MNGFEPNAVDTRQLDFPTSLSPMLVKELRQGIRTRGFVAAFIGLQLVMILVLGWSFAVESVAARDIFSRVNGLFWALITVVLVLVIPLRGTNGLNTELESKTIDLLMLTRLSAWRIVVGKWSSLMAQGLLLLLSLLPYGVLRYFFGSVDLIKDFKTIVLLMLFCVILTALTLVASGQGKASRLLIPIGLIFFIQGTGMSVFLNARTNAGGGLFVQLGDISGPMLFLYVIWGSILCFFFLLCAARRIAPNAETYTFPFRLLVLASLMVGIILNPIGTNNASIHIAFCMAMLCCAAECTNHSAPMMVHLRPFLHRGDWNRILGNFFLPGWQSAVLFTVASLGLFGLLGAFSALRVQNASWLRTLWWLSLGWQALVFPTLLIAFFPSRKTVAGVGIAYFLIQAVFGIFSIVAVSLPPATTGQYPVLSLFAGVLPICSFWTTAASMTKQAIPTENLIGQVLCLGSLMALLYVRSQPYWQHVRMLRRKDAAAQVSLHSHESR